MKSPPRWAVFDLGKVLVHFDFSIAARGLAEKSRLTAEEIRLLIDQSNLLHRFETGHLDARAFHGEFSGLAGYRGTFEEFKPVFGRIFSPIERMIELHAELRARHVRACVFSNTNDLAVEVIREDYPFFADFDDYILSYQHGSMKPDTRIYEVVEERTGSHGAELLYIDDRPENIATGRARGWTAILHESPEATREAVRQTGLLG